MVEGMHIDSPQETGLYKCREEVQRKRKGATKIDYVALNHGSKIIITLKDLP